MMSTKVCDLKHQMINVVVEGIVRRKSGLNEKNNSKHFNFVLFQEDANIRFVAFKQAATKFYPIIENGKRYRFSKVAVTQNAFNGSTVLQIVLTTTVNVEALLDADDRDTVPFTSFRDINKLKSYDYVNVIGRISSFLESERILKNGEIKQVIIMTICDGSACIDLTFWDHLDTVRAITSEDFSTYVISVQEAKVNIYQGATTLNVNTETRICINPQGELADTLKNIDTDSASVNLSQRSDTQTESQTEFSLSILISAVKRELEKVNAKQEELKIKKVCLEDQLRFYESKL